MTHTDDDGTHHMPVTICWHCDRPLDAATNLPGQTETPDPGSVSLCMFCGAVAIFADDLRLRQPTRDELDKMGQDTEFRKSYLAFSWSRQYLMLNVNLMRDREDPDR